MALSRKSECCVAVKVSCNQPLLGAVAWHYHGSLIERCVAVKVQSVCLAGFDGV